MTLAISIVYRQQSAQAADKIGLARDKIGWFDFPVVPGGKGAPNDTLGGINGWLVTKGAPQEAVDFLKFFISQGCADASLPPATSSCPSSRAPRPASTTRS